MKRFFLYILLSFVPLLCACAGQNDFSFTDETETYDDYEALNEESRASLRGKVYVSCSGCVVNPGVYIMPEGSRVYDVINAAGGITRDGDENRLNLVNIIQDGDRIVVPEKRDESDAAGDGDAEQVNINTATAAKLMTLPGIGETRAKAIISYRQAHGGFTKPEDIMKVSGIKEGTFEKIKDLITVY